MTGFDSKRKIAMDRLDDDDVQVYAQTNLKGAEMTKDEARTLEALKYAASKGYGRIVREMKIAPFTIKETLAQPAQEPLTDKQILADETLRYYFGQNGGAGPVSKQGRKVVDAIEAAHGIKKKNYG
jgi:hypothetical protein